MKNFLKIAEGIDVLPLLLALQRQPELWDRHPARKIAPDSPHAQMSDIWVRYNDDSPYEASGDYSRFNDAHFPVWYESYYALPELRPLIFGTMARVEGEHLGGVLITRIPPGGRIEPHRDDNWHVQFYSKFYLSLESAPGANFYCGDEVIAPRPGDCYYFDNREEHGVENNSNENRTTLIICVRTHWFEARHADKK
mgnify:CR=1 FL=1